MIEPSVQDGFCATCSCTIGPKLFLSLQKIPYTFILLGVHMEDKKSLIIMGLKPMLVDETLSVRVKMSMCQLCVALADHGFVQVDSGGQHVIQFLVTNLVSGSEPVGVRKF
jgi:hypothetical protein